MRLAANLSLLAVIGLAACGPQAVETEAVGDVTEGIGVGDVGGIWQEDAAVDDSGADTGVEAVEVDSGAPDVVGPLEPAPEFFGAPSASFGVLSFKGLINSEEANVAGKATLGVGAVEVHLGTETLVLDDQLTASLTVIPDDYEVEEMKGDAYVRIDGYRQAEGGGGTYLSIGAALPIDALIAMKESGATEAGLPVWSWFNVFDVDVTVRNDGVTFYRYCWRTHSDYQSGDSRIFVDHAANTAFAAGEALKVWMNVALLPETEVTPETEPLLCTYYMGSALVDGDTYYAGLAQDGGELSCPLPDGYLEPPEGDHFVLTFVGELNDLNLPNPTPEAGLSTASASVAGEPVNLDDYRSMAGRYLYAPTSSDYLYVQTIGSLDQTGTGAYRMLVSETTLLTGSALALADGESLLANAVTGWESLQGVHFTTLVKDVTQRIEGQTSYLRSCPLAVTDLSQESSVHLCHEPGALFEPGEVLELATRQALTTDPETLVKATGVATPCWCTRNDVETIPCDDTF